MTGFLSVFSSAPSHEEAEKIIRAVVEERLAACGNMMHGMHSVFHWQGKIDTADEYMLLFKTTAGKFDALEKRIRQLHSYECPCIVAWPIAAASQDFLDWIDQSTR